MEKYDIYNDIGKRTGGDIYVGVVGPVRVGKSTFVKRFAELLMMPNITGKNKKKIATDELPQSGAGKTVTTTEPKFIPSEAVKVTFGGKTTAKMRLIDCVGFMVDGAIGHEENGEPRMVQTPWNDSPVPFETAAEIGTDKVITEHSTIGVVVTTDGTVTEIPRENYEKAEELTVKKLQKIGKPFVICLNTKNPTSKETVNLKNSLEEKYGVSVVPIDVLNANEDGFTEIMEKALGEFPVKSADVTLPDWLRALPPDSRVVSEIISAVKETSGKLQKMKDGKNLENAVLAVDKIIPVDFKADAGEGKLYLRLEADKSLFYEVISETCGETIDGEYKLMSFVRDLSKAKWEYDRIRSGLEDADEKGYGIVLPSEKEISINEPELVKQGNRYNVKIKAETESLHVVKVGVKATVNPISGTKKQCEDFIDFISGETKEGRVSEVKVFGRPLGELVLDEINMKSGAMPEETRLKLKKAVTKMVNDNKYKVLYFVY